MKVVIAGAGVVGTSVGADLCANGHDVKIIESDQALVDKARKELPCGWHVGDACEVSTLQAVGMDDVDVVVAATGDDEDNLVV
ncbi:MAG: potassium transporter TrkA, partial [Candidatus Aeolococcus gillhamiae]